MSINLEQFSELSNEQSSRRLSPEVALRLLARCAGIGSADSEVTDEAYIKFIRGDLPELPNTQENRDAA